jgi:formylmethanofuran dehydrogenase subunit E
MGAVKCDYCDEYKPRDEFEFFEPKVVCLDCYEKNECPDCGAFECQKNH